MAYVVENEDGTFTLHPSPNVKIFMKLEDPEVTYALFEKFIAESNLLENIKNEEDINKQPK